MNNIELPARMSPCLRLFIESLLEELDEGRCVSFVPEVPVLKWETRARSRFRMPDCETSGQYSQRRITGKG